MAFQSDCSNSKRGGDGKGKKIVYLPDTIINTIIAMVTTI